MAVSVPVIVNSIDTHSADGISAFVIGNTLYIDGGEENLIQNGVQTDEQICKNSL